MKVAEGLQYYNFEYRESAVHILEADLTIRRIGPTPVGPDFPMWPYYSEATRLPALAKSSGALASVNGDFSITKYHMLGMPPGSISSQPVHTFVFDREIWTTGIGGGGYGFYIGDRQAHVQQNRLFITVWHRATKESLKVEHVNRGRSGKVVAFTPRGGTNEIPDPTKWHIVMGSPRGWKEEKGGQQRIYTITQVGYQVPVESNTIVLELKWPRPKVFHVGDEMIWSQRFGVPDVRHIMSGATGIIRDGKNIVSLLDIGPGTSNGPDNWYFKKNPRTVLAVSEDHATAFLVAVQGRGVDGSPGLRLKEMATMLLDFPISDAVNMDGGGSTLMWIRGLQNKGLVLDSSYGDGTSLGTRPLIVGTAVF